MPKTNSCVFHKYAVVEELVEPNTSGHIANLSVQVGDGSGDHAWLDYPFTLHDAVTLREWLNGLIDRRQADGMRHSLLR